MDAQNAPDVSLVVTVKDAAATLPGLLADLEALAWPKDRLEVVLVDAFSQDGTWRIVQEFAARSPLGVVTAQREGRIGAGRNEGFRLARAGLVAVTDADMRVPPGWLRELAAGMDDASVGVVGGPNESARRDLVARAVATIPVHGPSREAVPVFARNRWRADYTTSHDVYACVTRNSLFRRQAFEEAGGFDESLIATEDPELNQRILKAGWRLRYRTAAGVRHIHRETLGAFFRQQRNYAVGQAQANRRHPEMAAPRQRLPALALVLLVLALVFAGWDRAFLWVAAAIAGGALVFTLAYTLQAVIVRRDPALLVVLPWFVVTWQLAWAVGYPMGAWSRRRAD